MNNYKSNNFTNYPKNDNSINSSNNENTTSPQTDNYLQNQIKNDFVSVDDVYNDLSSQSLMLDNNISKSTPLFNRSYLPKRKIKEILFSKYGIKNDECINELYSMAFMNSWKEIDVEYWLLNPSNVNNLLEKCGEKKLIQAIDEQTDSMSLKNTKHNHNIDFNTQNKQVINHTPQCNHQQLIQPQHYISRDHLLYPQQLPHFYTTPQFNVSNIQNEIRSVLIEENYKKMQFDYQTEILKRHINDKFEESNKKDDVFGNYIDAKSIDKKLAKYFSSKSDEFSKDIIELKQNFENTENDVKETLDKMKNEFAYQLNKVKNDLSQSFNHLVIDAINKQLSQNYSKTTIDLEKKIESKFNDIIKYMNSFEEKIINKNKALIDDIGDLRGEFNSRVNNLSQDVKDTINNIYNDIDTCKTSIDKACNEFSEISKNQIQQLYDANNLNLTNNEITQSNATTYGPNHANNEINKSIEITPQPSENIETPEINNEPINNNSKRDLYNEFMLENNVSNESTTISNFDSNNDVNVLDIENQIDVKNDLKDQKEDIKSKFKRIDEIIKNSIDELNDIKEYVGDNEVRIDDSIKMFEQVK